MLLQLAPVDEDGVGIAGHSYGDYTAPYHAALDSRCRFACISGAVCSFETRRRAYLRRHHDATLLDLTPASHSPFNQ